jgi:hypothetical protein
MKYLKTYSLFEEYSYKIFNQSYAKRYTIDDDSILDDIMKLNDNNIDFDIYYTVQTIFDKNNEIFMLYSELYHPILDVLKFKIHYDSDPVDCLLGFEKISEDVLKLKLNSKKYNL